MIYTADCQDFMTELDAETLEDAKAETDEMIAYSQQNIYIIDEDGNEHAFRRWNRTLEGIEDCEDPIQFGEFGYFADWQDCFTCPTGMG